MPTIRRSSRGNTAVCQQTPDPREVLIRATRLRKGPTNIAYSANHELGDDSGSAGRHRRSRGHDTPGAK